LWPAILRRYTIVASIKRVNENPELPVSGFLRRLSRVPEDMERAIMSFVGKGSALVTAEDVEMANVMAVEVERESALELEKIQRTEEIERDHLKSEEELAVEKALHLTSSTALQGKLDEQEFMMLPEGVKSRSSSGTIGVKRGRSDEDEDEDESASKR
jgi:hypothetical protein